MSRPNLIAIVWAPYESRTATIARYLNAPLFCIHYLMWKRPWIAPLKYVLQWFKTWFILLKHRPKLIFVTNSPPIAPLSVYCLTRITRTPYIMDTHPPTLYNRKWGWSQPLTRFLARAAYLNIVDQERFKALFESWGARAIVLENAPKSVDLATLQEVSGSERFSITLVGTLAEDEPVDVVIEAAKQLPDVDFFILGDRGRARRSLLHGAPDNVTFTGYLRGDDYWARLRASNAVMSVTTHAYSLLAGAQDGVAVQRPLILSNQPALTAYFTRGTVFVENAVEAMVHGVRKAQEQEQQLKAEIELLAEEHKQSWDGKFDDLLQLVS